MSGKSVPPLVPRLLLAVCAMAIVFGGAEGILRIAGFFYQPFANGDSHGPYNWIRLFANRGKPFDPAKDTTYTVMPNLIADQHINPKREGTLRVAVIGGSSVYAWGDAASMAHDLEAAYGRPVDVVNVGLLGQGSLVLRSVIDQVITLDPDLYVIYTGHNEFLAAYLYRFTPGPVSQSVQRLIGHSRLLQFVTYGYHRLQALVYGKYIVERSATGDFFLNTFHSRSVHSGYRFSQKERDGIYGMYADNLRAMIDAIRAKNTHAAIVLGTVAYNRKSPPEIWDGKPSPSEAEFASCRALESDGKFPEAEDCYEHVVLTEPFPRRANNTTNAAVRAVAREKGVVLYDVDAMMVELSKNGIPDYDLFRDHCHLNDRGNGLLLSTLAKLVAANFTFR